jgi:hypothetical protein
MHHCAQEISVTAYHPQRVSRDRPHLIVAAASAIAQTGIDTGGQAVALAVLS